MASMEKRLSLMRLLTVFLFFLLPVLLYSQTLSQAETSLRFSLWALMDEEPSVEYKYDESKHFFDFSVQRLKTLAPFVLEGMIYGWKFSYTPYDKRRQVEEYFSFEPLRTIQASDRKLIYKEPWFAENKINCWVEYNRTPEMINLRHAWESIKNPKIGGRGKGRIQDGVEGIQSAYSEAIKEAVRSYARGLTKNKPKEIEGTVLLYDYPRLYIQSGNYVADLDFLLEIGSISSYSNF